MSTQTISADDSATSVDLTVLSLNDLATRLDSAPRERYESKKEGVTSSELLLCELVRRGGIAAERILSKKLAAQDEKIKAVRDVIKSLPEEGEEAFKQERLAPSKSCRTIILYGSSSL